jgi:hypothetical protein
MCCSSSSSSIAQHYSCQTFAEFPIVSSMLNETARMIEEPKEFIVNKSFLEVA